MADARIIQIDLSNAEIQELSKEEMENVQGAALNSYFRTTGETQGEHSTVKATILLPYFSVDLN